MMSNHVGPNFVPILKNSKMNTGAVDLWYPAEGRAAGTGIHVQEFAKQLAGEVLCDRGSSKSQTFLQVLRCQQAQSDRPDAQLPC